MANPQSSKTFDVVKKFLSGRIPGQVVIQYTDACNAKCPQCGMNMGANFKRSRLGLDAVKRTIDTAVLNGVKSLSFTGGEPLIYLEDVVALIKYAGEAGMEFIRTGTNGFLFMNSDRDDFRVKVTRVAEALAETKLRNFWISLDSSVPEVHEEMRGLPGVVKGIEKALPIFHEHGIYPSANLGINRNIGGQNTSGIKFNKSYPDVSHFAYRQAFRKFLKLITNLGFTMVNMCYPMSLDDSASDAGMEAVYGATSTDSVVKFVPEEKQQIFRALFDSIPEYRPRIRTFTPLCSLHALMTHYSGQPDYSYPCRGGIDFFFVDAKNGDAYPCGYRGNDNLGKLWDLDFSKIDKRRDCRLCDWECFRDPSELLGPVLDLAGRPLSLVKRFWSDREYARLWWGDLGYFRACDFFNGRVPPDYRKLNKK